MNIEEEIKKIVKDLTEGLEEVLKDVTIKDSLELIYQRNITKLTEDKYKVKVTFKEKNNKTDNLLCIFTRKTDMFNFTKEIIDSPYVVKMKVSRY